jgi:hypothetical protein
MITDADQLTEVAWRVLETDNTLNSGIFTVAEVANYFNQRQNRFNRDALLVLAHQPLVGVAAQATYDLPQDWIATLRVTWKPVLFVGDNSGAISPVTKSSRYAAEHGLQDSNLPALPIGFDDTSSPGTLQIEMIPPPQTNGVIEILYACVLEALGFGVVPDIFDTPDEFVPFITYGVLADMFSKLGQGESLELAAYCEERYQEGIGIAKLLIAGMVS